MVEQPAQDAAVKRRRERSLAWEFRHLIPMVAIAISAIAIWELIFRSGVWGFLFPGPTQVARALVDFWNSTRLVRAIVATLRRLAVGFLISLVLGALLAFLMVRFTTFGKGIQPYILGLQTFPSIAWVPLSLIWFGFSDALRTVPPVYLQAARNMGSDGMDLILRVTVPAALPHLISAAKVGWSFAWRSLIGAEIIFATVGLGFLLNASASVPDIAGVMGVMLVILVIGIVVDQLAFTKTQEWASRRRGLRPRR
ncbi:MAG: ABC transporter permease subunit [Methanobacteriota archaeon]|nr:MAG: ABC transporter permease subunit [Euryarchaeota archaeon]